MVWYFGIGSIPNTVLHLVKGSGFNLWSIALVPEVLKKKKKKVANKNNLIASRQSTPLLESKLLHMEEF